MIFNTSNSCLVCLTCLTLQTSLTALHISDILNSVISVKDWLQGLREKGFGLYEAMDYLDLAATRNGYDGPAFYGLLGEVYAGWEEPRHRLRRYIKPEHTQEEWEEKKHQYNNRCFYCGRKCLLTRDHITPIKTGGTDKIDNIIPACRKCNSKKGVKEVAIFKNGATLKLL